MTDKHNLGARGVSGRLRATSNEVGHEDVDVRVVGRAEWFGGAAAADLNGDGITNNTDINLFVANFLNPACQ